MTQPMNVEQPKVKASAYVQPTVGGVNLGRENGFATIGLALGGQVQLKDGTYAKAEVAGGTYLGAKASVGHEFNIGKNMGLDLSVNGQFLQNRQSSSVIFTNNTKINVNNLSNGESNCYNYESLHVGIWNEGDSRVNGKAMFNLNGKAGKIGVGVEAGYKTNHGINIEGIDDINVSVKYQEQKADTYDVAFKEENYSESITYKFQGFEQGAYVTPKIEAELNLGKKGHAQIVADADLKQQNVGFRWTF